ncbi:HK97 family phage prohead protease [Treponema zuelzerae]|uniref:HK97 family phage prohead protease n=1 Tax=Teretinema zuelzerae TaxID=156 RepID=A0AAE3EJ41_9SPIR|nr:HK97 family phage prohead protease [Teretinema zuelzerae]MCD1654723.1 HK97 family phage prohead protease [Teretinema zuelzerae]
MAKRYELREYQAKIEIREQEGAAKVLTGVIPYLSRSENMGGFFEVIAPSAFAHTLNDGADVKCLIDHDRSKILGRVKNETLKLRSESDGLHFEVELANTSYANDLYENVRTGNITSISFGFYTLIDEWDTTVTPALRTLKDVKLIEISFVVFPAYPEAQAQARSKAFEDSGFEELEGLLLRAQNQSYQFSEDDKKTIVALQTALQSLTKRSENKIQEPKVAVIPETYYENLKKEIPR